MAKTPHQVQRTQLVQGDSDSSNSNPVPARLSDGQYQASIDRHSGAVQTLDIEHYLTHDGRLYSSGFIFEGVVNDGNAEVLLVTGDTSPHAYATISSSGDSFFHGYEGVAASNQGTTLAAINKNRTLAEEKTALTAVYRAPTVTDTGTALVQMFMPGGRKNQASGAGGGLDGEFVLKPNTNYLIRVTNKSGSAATISIEVTWYEGTN